MGAPTEIHLTTRGNTDLWTAVDVKSGVASQGETRESALENLDKAVAGYEGSGRLPTDGELRELGIHPKDNESLGELPDVLQ